MRGQGHGSFELGSQSTEYRVRGSDVQTTDYRHELTKYLLNIDAKGWCDLTRIETCQ
jgi:hypothetical protein